MERPPASIWPAGTSSSGWVLAFAYYVGTETAIGGSLGKIAIGLRVVHADGCAIGWGQSLVRNVLRPIDFLFIYLVAAVSVWSSRSNRCRPLSMPPRRRRQ